MGDVLDPFLTSLNSNRSFSPKMSNVEFVHGNESQKSKVNAKKQLYFSLFYKPYIMQKKKPICNAY